MTPLREIMLNEVAPNVGCALHDTNRRTRSFCLGASGIISLELNESTGAIRITGEHNEAPVGDAAPRSVRESLGVHVSACAWWKYEERSPLDLISPTDREKVAPDPFPNGAVVTAPTLPPPAPASSTEEVTQPDIRRPQQSEAMAQAARPANHQSGKRGKR